jgi:putative ABC transport system substrate-binding protein
VPSSRRSLLAFAFSSAAGRALAQVPSPGHPSPPLIAWLSQEVRETGGPFVEGILENLGKLGDVRGRDFILESRFAERQLSRIPVLARELVAMRPALIIAFSNTVTAAVLAETRSIPVIFVNSVSPVANGLVASLARPGGSATGTTYNPLEIGGKMVEALYAVAPRARRVTVVWNPDSQNGAMRLYKPFTDRAAQRLHLAYTYVNLARAQDFTAAAILATRPEALYVATDPVVMSVMPDVLRIASDYKLPSISVYRGFAEAGGLLALLPDQVENLENVADLVHRVLHGANPGELPVREPTRFQLVLNMRTARAIGLPITRDMLMQASEVID